MTSSPLKLLQSIKKTIINLCFQGSLGHYLDELSPPWLPHNLRIYSQLWQRWFLLGFPTVSRNHLITPLTLNIERLHHIMIDELKVFMPNPVLHIPFPPCEEVVHHSHLVAIHHQFISQVGTHETSPTSNLVEEYTCMMTSVKDTLAITAVKHCLRSGSWLCGRHSWLANTMESDMKRLLSFYVNYSFNILRQQWSLNQ